MWIKDETFCSIEGCWKPVKQKGWCGTHYQQFYKQHPSYRPRDGYDGRRKNKLYAMWFDRKNEGLLCEEWHKDFRAFEKGISPRPEGDYFLIRLRDGLFGPDNFQWQPHLRKREGESNKEWWARKWAHRQQKFPSNERARNLKRYYGITPERYNELLKEQNNACAICRKEETAIDGKSGTIKRLSIDHCHTSNNIRGLLCGRCNTTLGKLEDNVNLLQAMINYLNKHKV